MKHDLVSIGTMLSLAAVVLLPTTAVQAALVVPAGNSLVLNDTDLNVTWTQDANLFKTLATASGSAANFVTTIINSVGGKIYDTQNVYDTPASSGYHTLKASDFNTTWGLMTWWGAQAWVGYLNSISYGGVAGWRLPTTSPAVAGYNQTDSELGHLFYTDLGGVADHPITITHNATYNLFNNVQSDEYWSGTENALLPENAWLFFTAAGYQNYFPKSSQFYAWAVRPGQVTSVPVPAAVLLMGSALFGFLGFGRRKAATLGIR